MQGLPGAQPEAGGITNDGGITEEGKSRKSVSPGNALALLALDISKQISLAPASRL